MFLGGGDAPAKAALNLLRDYITFQPSYLVFGICRSMDFVCLFDAFRVQCAQIDVNIWLGDQGRLVCSLLCFVFQPVAHGVVPHAACDWRDHRAWKSHRRRERCLSPVQSLVLAELTCILCCCVPNNAQGVLNFGTSFDVEQYAVLAVEGTLVTGLVVANVDSYGTVGAVCRHCVCCCLVRSLSPS